MIIANRNFAYHFIKILITLMIYNEAIRIDPNNFNAYYNKGYYY